MQTSAIEMLKEDHDRFKTLLTQLVASHEDKVDLRRQLLETIEKELKMHTRVEEELFYPAFKSGNGQGTDKKSEKLYYQAKEEHRAVEDLVMPDLKNAQPDSIEFTALAQVLKELVENHAMEEEQDMFTKARDNLTQSQLMQLGEQMADRKRELANQM